MAKGYDQHQQRSRALSQFGKDLTRSDSRCELCEAGGQSLRNSELPPMPAEPAFERCLFVCEQCARELEGGAIANLERWRCLNNTLWSEVPAVQAAAVLMLRRLADDAPWAGELLEQAYLSDEVKALLGEATSDDDEETP